MAALMAGNVQHGGAVSTSPDVCALCMRSLLECNRVLS
jgi:hypothetical protein